MKLSATPTCSAEMHVQHVLTWQTSIKQYTDYYALIILVQLILMINAQSKHRYCLATKLSKQLKHSKINLNKYYLA